LHDKKPAPKSLLCDPAGPQADDIEEEVEDF